MSFFLKVSHDQNKHAHRKQICIEHVEDSFPTYSQLEGRVLTDRDSAGKFKIIIELHCCCFV